MRLPLLLVGALGCGPHDEPPVERVAPRPAAPAPDSVRSPAVDRAAPAAVATSPDAARSPAADHVQQLQAFCARVAAEDAGYLRAHVKFPLVRRINASGDLCSSGNVPCEYRPKSIVDPAALVRERPCETLNFNDPPRIVEVGTDWVVDAVLGQMPDWLWFTSSPDGSARLLKWDAKHGP